MTSLAVTPHLSMDNGSGIGELTETTWSPPDGITYERWEAIGNTILRMVRSSTWWLGDWWRFGEHTYGERASQAAPTGAALKTLQNAAWVADRIEPQRRRTDLTFDHHSSVAAMQPDQQDVVLDQAEGNGWNSRETRAEVRRIRSGGTGAGPDAEVSQGITNDELARLKAKAEDAIRNRDASVIIAPATLLMLTSEVERARR